ncbi:MAG TPA: UDP-glucose 4-epimerase GalE [Candidatus Ruania gallistercoris]|uniref:UDP-glucose 4-epimerase n=1 Tax=Candidatus Ruania gallistercoris TaxID=2838746 RepID=A0A9D2EEU5_9MICO|nr:UDP-glucose 4-epimerase GalE [Candidatus Ruania gallistercoris]
MKVLVTGGAGYIGSVTASALEDAGHVPVLLDSLVTGPRLFTEGRIFYHGDIADRELLRRIVAEHPEISATVHLAARTVVPESIAEPALYYRENVVKSLELFDELTRLERPRVVFSSSAAVYGPAPDFEVSEDHLLAPASPYGRTKLMVEQILADLAVGTGLRALVLRYFNPIGSDPQLRSGVYAGNPSHVLGQLVRTALGEQEVFTLTGTDLPTRDGTGLRDYVHVWDVARAHVRAVDRFDDALTQVGTDHLVLNVGTGQGVTVRELHTAVEKVSGVQVPVRTAPSRAGDAVGAYANVDRAADLLGWRAELSLEDGIDSSLAWMRRRTEVLGG